MKSTTNYNFSNVPPPEIQRSTFDRSHGHKTTFNSGLLIPIFCDEILPGDTVKLVATLMARLTTFIFPIMDNIFLDTFFFYVPCRLLWSDWEHFNGAQDNPADSTSFLIPVLHSPQTYGAGTIYDYFGIPTQQSIATADPINALPFRAYNLIYNDWFKDQNLQNNLVVDTGPGPDLIAHYTLQRRNKRHDYFSSCLPWPQKGTAVALPLGTSAPVIGNSTAIGWNDGTRLYGFGTDSALGADGYYHPLLNTALLSAAVGTTNAGAGTAPGNVASTALGLSTVGTYSGMIADLSNATAATVNSLRQVFQFQKILERDARGGTRYVEMLKAHFGVTSPDFRLQRPEYLGGSSQRINVSSVPQTSVTAATPQGTLAAYSVGHSQCSFNKSFVEHGYIIGLANVRADVTYQGGLHKMWSRQTRFDFYLPALAHLGEQAVLTKEINYQAAGTPDAVFGYQERWAEYRYKPSLITGSFRSNTPGGALDPWHLAIDFGTTAPTLNATFMADNPPINRVVAVSDVNADQILLDSYFSMKHTRPMPTYSVPGQIDRF